MGKFDAQEEAKKLAKGAENALQADDREQPRLLELLLKEIRQLSGEQLAAVAKVRGSEKLNCPAVMKLQTNGDDQIITFTELPCPDKLSIVLPKRGKPAVKVSYTNTEK